MPKQQVYYPALEALRVIALAGVVLYHYYPQHLPGAFIGVDIFLVLSGFLLARSLEAKYNRGEPFHYGAFLAKRAWRLWWPLFWMLLLAIGFINCFAPSFLFNVRATALSGLTFSNNWWQVLQGASYFAEFVHPSAFTHLWYVALIMQVFVVFPLILRACQRLLGHPLLEAAVLVALALVSALAMGLIYEPGGDPSRVYYGTDTRAFAFLLGAAGGLLKEGQVGRRLAERWPLLRRLPVEDGLALVGLVGLVILARQLMDQTAFTYRGGLFLASLVALVTIFGLSSKNSVLARLLSWKPLVWLGNRTYALYLWYYPVYAVLGRMSGLQKVPALQWLILLGLGVLTHSLAQGQMGRFLKGWLQGLLARPREAFSRETFLNDLRRWPGRAVALVLILAFAGSALVGVLRAPAGENQTVAELQAQLAETQRKLEAKKRAEDRAQVEAMGAIEGLTDAERLFAADANVTFIGDSILLSAATPLAEAFPKATIDGQVGRQLNQSGAVVDQLAENGQLAETVVVVLGSNGPFTEDQLEDLASRLGKRRLYFVNTHVNRQWQESVNEMLAAYVKGHKNAHLIDWKSHVAPHPEWLYEDQTHCNPEGASAFMQLVVKTLYEDLGQAPAKETSAAPSSKGKQASTKAKA
ncbi:acyltransferase family protein [Peptococcus simiae]|uniref:Acyltransferase family protein n=1 Tax=Peptococcus simiae TaxID=1643805 RepID=A0ABW9GYI0_9FIRM